MATAINLQEKTWEKISQFFKEFGIYDPNTQIEWIEKNIHPIVNNYIYHIDNQQNRDAMNSDINQLIDTKLLPVIRDKKLDKQPFLINDPMYQIIDDNGVKSWFDRKVVIPLEEWRDKKLNDLLD